MNHLLIPFLLGCRCHAPNSNKHDRNATSSVLFRNSYYCKLLLYRHIILLNHLVIKSYTHCSISYLVACNQVAENLAQLMYSVLMTGYMFRNAQYRLELQQSLEQVALPDSSQERKVHFQMLAFRSNCKKEVWWVGVEFKKWSGSFFVKHFLFF